MKGGKGTPAASAGTNVMTMMGGKRKSRRIKKNKSKKSKKTKKSRKTKKRGGDSCYKKSGGDKCSDLKGTKLHECMKS